MRFVEKGAGTPVLALHGWTPDHRLMLGCLEPIFEARPGYRRLYPDLPGMGATPAPPGIASSDDVLAEVRRFIDAEIGQEPFLLLGESYGGYLSRALTRDIPQRIRGVAMICPTGVVRREDRARPAHQVLRRDPALDLGDDPRFAAEFAEMAVVQTAETVRRFREDVWDGLEIADTTTLARIEQRWELSADPESGPPFTRPSLILTGLQDASVGFSDQFALLPHYPRATFAVLDVAGHNLQFEQPTLFNALINEWLDRVAAE
ncbi:pimeloyl-ACP methyl ester carboxylesterase [Actinoplanes lutulentus]|uniref:Pimeloyl-ACP methyl ester carboxylesterase n=1 Tax=Actinoplanes lutulentus TaxID=1287878 RepID=A0A327ZIL4_9ACTN|nr:alpha/beta hydrolase [Actinoplanes lutulentus]MBB2944538.1 pimeloyl-ACP methyl ester carboxylesterase [Actinoplanes lutulentus]RAK42230.1 pimeloyl-ACP methyl ester carboxylesterase [Actinoplanes lutulentus]